MFVALLALLALSACGFRPLYGKTEAGGSKGVALELSAIKIAQIPDRDGQVLRNHLLDLLTPRGEPKLPKYEIQASLAKSRQELGVKKSAFATRANLFVTVNYTFHDLSAEPPEALFNSSVTSVASFNVFDSDFATEVAEQDAVKRALKQIGEQMRLQISARLKQGPDPS